MGSRYKSVVGWERYGDLLLLRMKLTQPELKRVWPGTPSLQKPESELRLLNDELLAYDEVKAAAGSMKCDGKFSAADLRLLGKALCEAPVRRPVPIVELTPS